MNYKHLHYFVHVAQAGSVTRASKLLHLTPQTISGQIQLLEESLGTELFEKSGRGLTLTDAGRVVLGYAEDIFSLGNELKTALSARHVLERVLEFKVGVVNAISKSIAYRLIEPAMRVAAPVRVVCRESTLESLLADLAVHQLDLVIADSPLTSAVSVRAFNHRLGASTVSIFASPALRALHPASFPACLNEAPLLMPSGASASASPLRDWFRSMALQPRVVGEFDDSALAKEFGRRGVGFFVAPTVLTAEIEAQHGVQEVGVVATVSVEYFAISVERRVTHPCVIAITNSARGELFATGVRQAKTKARSR